MSQRKQVGTSQRTRARDGDYISVVSDLDEPYLSPGASSRHRLNFKLLTPLELEVEFEVECPGPGVLHYPDEAKVWNKTHTFGGFQPDLRIANFDSTVTVHPDFAASGESKNQRLSLRTRARCGQGPWRADVELDHPVTIAE